MLEELSVHASDIAVTGASGLLGLVMIGRYLWRRFSRDRVEVIRDRAEENLIRKLQDERDAALTRADQAISERNAALRAHDLLAGEVGGLRKRIEELSTELHALREQFNAAIRGAGPARPLN